MGDGGLPERSDWTKGAVNRGTVVVSVLLALGAGLMCGFLGWLAGRAGWPACG
jgi:hypothetical protein